MKFGGAVVGALLGPLLVFIVVAGVYDAPRSENWDWVTPALTMGAMVFAAFVGAVGGFFVGGALQSGQANAALKIGVVSAVIVLAPALFILSIPYLPRPEFVPAKADARAKWASEQTALHPLQGMGLANSLEGCMRRLSGPPSARYMRNGCNNQKRSYFGKGPDTVAALGGYIMGDDGWRWDMVEDAVYHAIVFPDPLLGNQPGPVFDVKAFRILRRATRNAPGFFTDAFLPNMVASLRCMANRATDLKRVGTWNGDGTTLPPLLVGPDSSPGGCPIAIDDRPENPRAIWTISISGNGLLSPHRVEYRWVPNGRATAYEVYFYGNGVGFMVDDAGGWHMKNGVHPYTRDPPPPPCMFDLTVACE